MRRLFAVPVLVLSLAASGRAFAAEGPNEKALREADEKWQKAFVAKDAAGVTEYYADDAIMMDPGPMLWFRGKAEIKKSFEDFFAGADAIAFTMKEQTYRVVGNLGYGAAIFDASWKDKKSGQAMSMKGRTLTVFEKRKGKWVAVADHASFPVAAPAPTPAPVPAPAEAPAKP